MAVMAMPMAAVTVMVIIVIVVAVRPRRRRQRPAARAVGEGERRARALLADARLFPVAHAVRESRLQPRPLRRLEIDRGVVDWAKRHQLTLENVLRQRPAGDLPRRSPFRQPAEAVGLRGIGRQPNRKTTGILMARLLCMCFVPCAPPVKPIRAPAARPRTASPLALGVAREQLLHGGLWAQTAFQHPVDGIGHRHVDATGLGELRHLAGGVDALGDVPKVLQNLL